MKITTDRKLNTTHAVGDRWQHSKWPRGTPDAVVGEVTPAGSIRWASLGGAEAPTIMTRFLNEQHGWTKVVG